MLNFIVLRIHMIFNESHQKKKQRIPQKNTTFTIVQNH